MLIPRTPQCSTNPPSARWHSRRAVNTPLAACRRSFKQMQSSNEKDKNALYLKDQNLNSGLIQSPQKWMCLHSGK